MVGDLPRRVQVTLQCGILQELDTPAVGKPGTADGVADEATVDIKPKSGQVANCVVVFGAGQSANDNTPRVSRMPRHRALQPLLDRVTQPLAIRGTRLCSVAWRHASAAKLVGNLPPDAEIAGEGIPGDERLEVESALDGITTMAVETESLQQRANGIRRLRSLTGADSRGDSEQKNKSGKNSPKRLMG